MYCPFTFKINRLLLGCSTFYHIVKSSHPNQNDNKAFLQLHFSAFIVLALILANIAMFSLQLSQQSRCNVCEQQALFAVLHCQSFGNTKQVLELVLWNPSTHPTVCSVGTSRLPGRDLQACRKIPLIATPTIPQRMCCQCGAQPSCRVDEEGGQGALSAYVCLASATVNTT